MNEAGRLLVSDPPDDTAASRFLSERNLPAGLLSYDELLEDLASRCEGYSGAALAGVARAAASHALERAVNEFSQGLEGETGGNSIMDCLVTKDDFIEAVDDVLSSMGTSDFADDDEAESTENDNETVESDDTGDDDPITPA